MVATHVSQFAFELSESESGFENVAGVDEAGRGPIAGDVVAAAVILDRDHPVQGLNDSKKLTQRMRETCFDQIIESAKAYGIARASVAEIDEYNILNASLMAMKRAVESMSIEPEIVFVDGTFVPSWSYRSQALVKGDSRMACIAAASILAKVTRDREMVSLAEQYPRYGFERHKGYPTRAHIEALEKYGPCAHHRRTFKPVAAIEDLK